MSDYGYYHGEARNRKRERKGGSRGGLLLFIVDIVAFVLTFISAFALVMALFSKWISPAVAPIFAFFGLFYPIIYLFNAACALWWTVRWRKWFFISFAVLFAGFWNMNLFYRSDWRKEYDQTPKSNKEITIVSYNVMNFSGFEPIESPTDSIIAFLNSRRPQIVCLQEAYFSQSFDIEELERRLTAINYSIFLGASGSGGNSGSGVAVLSAYPIVASGRTQIDTDAARSLWVDLKIGRDTLRVICNHLQSTSIDNDDRKSTLSPQIIDDSLARKKLMVVARKMADNYARRAEQAERLAEAVALSPHATIVCGDFNDTPMSYAYATVSKRLTDAYVACGRGTDATYQGFWSLFRIDYLLFSDGVTVKSYRSFDVDISDHRPIEARFEIPAILP